MIGTITREANGYGTVLLISGVSSNISCSIVAGLNVHFHPDCMMDN